MYLHTNAIALQQRHSSTNTLKTRNGHYHWIYTDACNRTMACIPNENVWTSNTQRHWHTEYEHATRICPKINTLNNFKLYTQSCSRLRIALKCCLSNLTRTSDDFVECDLKQKNGQYDGAKRLDWQIMICFSLEMWWYFIDSTSLQKLKKICSSAKQHQSYNYDLLSYLMNFLILFWMLYLRIL